MPYDDTDEQAFTSEPTHDAQPGFKRVDFDASAEAASFEADVRMTLSFLEPEEVTELRNRIAEALRRGNAGTH